MNSLPELLERHRDLLVRHLARRGGGLLRFETPEDLAQSVHLHAINVADRFAYRGEGAFVRWLLRLAKQHIADRIEYWTALKRDAGPMLRITFGAEPAGRVTGPVTRASRNEMLEVAATALDGLPPRDREIVRWMSAGASIDDLARQLGIGRAAAQRARLRAVERFKKIFTIVARKVSP